MLLLFALVSLAIIALPADRGRKRPLLAGNTSLFARLGLLLLGVRVTLRRRKRRRGRRRRAYLVLANHLSYADILVVASVMPAVFVTSVELRRSFPLGLLARFGGSLFVERRSPSGLKREIGAVARVLSEGTSVVLFPEGTTSNGDTVRPFKNSLLTAALATGTPLLPVCIRYLRIDGRPVGRGNRDAVHYYGGITFFEHLPRLLRLRSVDAECVVLPPIAVRPGRTRKDLAAQAHEAISTVYHRRHAGREG
jgi:1-acyl-sn-glycerol-3-phosphate acyltransferase